MSAPDHLEDLIEHLGRQRDLPPQEASRLVEEVLAYFAESPDVFVARRHRELKRAGLANAVIYARIARELGERRFAAPPLSERQIRRLIYG